MSRLNSKYKQLLLNLLFFLSMFVFWRFFYVNHLLYKEQMQLFLLTPKYLMKHLQFQGGFAIYLGEFVTQFFRNPWIAALLVSMLFLLLAAGIQRVLKKVFGDKVFILSFLPSVFYCILLCDSFYEFSGLIAVLASIWMVSIYLTIRKVSIRYILGFVFVTISYWLFGGAFILFLSSILVVEIISKTETLKKKIPFIMSCVFFSILLPYICYSFLVTDHLKSTYFSRAFYQLSLIIPTSLIAVFFLPAFLVLIYGFVTRITKTKIVLAINGLMGFLLAITLVLGLSTKPNFEEERERKYSILVEQKDWDTIIDEAEKEVELGREGKLALSLALAQKGQMSSRLFDFEPRLGEFFIPFDWKGQAPIVANEPYFFLGLNNFSKMLCNESIESTPNEKMPVRAVKRLIENYIIDGQYEIAERYLWYLENTLFYRKWAKGAKVYLFNDSKVDQHTLWGNLRRHKTKDDFYFQYDRNDVALITLLRSNQQNRLAYEYLMSWYLLQKDFDEFLKYLPLVRTMDYTEFPLVFQEALAYVLTLLEDVPDELKQFPISAEVQQNLNRYAQAFQSGGSNNPDEMKKQFGKTYWYYVHFIETENE